MPQKYRSFLVVATLTFLGFASARPSIGPSCDGNRRPDQVTAYREVFGGGWGR